VSFWNIQPLEVTASHTAGGFETTVGLSSTCTLRATVGIQDHITRVDYFTVTIENSGVDKNIVGSGLSALWLVDSVHGRLSITECRVRTVSSESKLKASHSDTTGIDEVFSFRKHDCFVVLTG
jgi:hypothetical protein